MVPVCVADAAYLLVEKTKFACVDGPEFDGHEVDYDELSKRLQAYQADERSVWINADKISNIENI